MSSKPDEAKAGLIEKTVEHARAKLPPDQAARLEAFIRIYYGAVAAEDLLERGVGDLYGAALGHLNFGSRRTPGEPRSASTPRSSRSTAGPRRTRSSRSSTTTCPSSSTP